MGENDAATEAALITGASSGIGLATAQALWRAGWSVVLSSRSEDRLQSVSAGFDARPAQRLIAITADMSSQASIDALFDRIESELGGIDALVNNAGSGGQIDIDDHTWEHLEESFRLNTIGPAYAMIRAWPGFRSRGGGCVVQVSSFATLDPFPGFFAYAAAKSGMESLSRSGHNEGAPHGIRCFSIGPGAVETPLLRGLFDESIVPRAAALAPEDVAKIIAECISGTRDDQMGKTIYVRRADDTEGVLEEVR